jgi:hypothetical protein
MTLDLENYNAETSPFIVKISFFSAARTVSRVKERVYDPRVQPPMAQSPMLT